MIEVRNHPLPRFHPDQYLLYDPGLEKAVNVAIALDQPLLLTGEPGTGKTLLAYKVAHELAKNEKKYKFRPKPLIFNTKTTSSSRDLFYTYDALGHFQDANIKREVKDQGKAVSDFIELQALGKAIALTQPKMLTDIPVKLMLDGEPADIGSLEPQSSVVLIDEIDKAPRDFPNDILHEIDNYEFRLKEFGNQWLRPDENQRLVVIMTSNSEKNLPDAFLRRCIFYHIPFPDKDKLIDILDAQLGFRQNQYNTKLVEELVSNFLKLREETVQKKPATAELVAWMRLLAMDGVLDGQTSSDAKALLAKNLSVLVKNKDDLNKVRESFKSIS